MKHFSHLHTAAKIIDAYKGAQPFGLFIKEFFRADKKYGSRDRKQITHLCYCYFRLGKAGTSLATEERILLGLFLCTDAATELLGQLQPAWNELTSLSLTEKIEAAGQSFSPLAIFPFNEQLSDQIDAEQLALSHLHQPDLFIRLRPGKTIEVERKLQQAAIPYERTGDCLALANGSKIEEVIVLNKEAVVQDRNSQRVGELLQMVKENALPEHTLKVWDCCAASGGKSIMASDLLGNIDLMVSDVRRSILVNLQRRFAEAGINEYKRSVIDLSVAMPSLPGKYDLVIADVPCTGSGTWSRTPEQLYYFEEEKIEVYASLQKKIVQHILPAIAGNGYLLYITCSVFKKENEEMIAFIEKTSSCRVIQMNVLTGYDKKADTLFAALLQNRS